MAGCVNEGGVDTVLQQLRGASAEPTPSVTSYFRCSLYETFSRGLLGASKPSKKQCRSWPINKSFPLDKCQILSLFDRIKYNTLAWIWTSKMNDLSRPLSLS